MYQTIKYSLLISLLFILNESIAGNYSDKIFKKDSVFTIFRETQIGKNFFDAGSNKLYTYTAKLGIQYYCFQFGVNAEREFIFTSAFNQDYLQRTKALGLFLGIELPVTKNLGIGIVGIYSAYKNHTERLFYNELNETTLEYNNYSIFQTQLRLNYQLNREFSLLGSANFNVSPAIFNEGKIDKSNFFRFNLGLRYSLYPLNYDLASNADTDNNRIRIFAGSNLEWKNAQIPNFIGTEQSVPNSSLVELPKATGDNVKSQVFALLGIADKRNNMILFGLNQRDYTEFSKSYNKLNSSQKWKMEMSDFSARLAFELNLFSFVNKEAVNHLKPIYPFYRVTTTYSNKNFRVIGGWDNSKYATDTSSYQPKVDNKAQTQSLEINNSLGLAMKLNRLYVSAGFNVFNRTYGEVKYERMVTREYYQGISPQNVIESKTEILPVLETKGWLDKPNNPINVFFTIGLVL